MKKFLFAVYVLARSGVHTVTHKHRTYSRPAGEIVICAWRGSRKSTRRYTMNFRPGLPGAPWFKIPRGFDPVLVTHARDAVSAVLALAAYTNPALLEGITGSRAVDFPPQGDAA